MTITIASAKSYFETGDKPTQEQFASAISMFGERLGLAANVTALQAFGTARVADLNAIYLKGKVTAGDGGGGVFQWEAASTVSADSGTVYAIGSAATGRLVRGDKGLLNIKWFGATGDGTTDDTAAIQAALDTGKSIFVPNGEYVFTTLTMNQNGQQIIGEGRGSWLRQTAEPGYLEIDGATHIAVRNIRFGPNDSFSSAAGMRVKNSAADVTIDGVYFRKGSQRIWLHTCERITVSQCNFDNTGYGIITQAGQVANNVLITGCMAYDMTSDFVEANSATVDTKNWTITNNLYLGNAGWPAATTEDRFVGITQVENVIITGNIVEKVAGDAVIHLEDTLGEVIVSDNIFDKCQVSDGNNGIVYILNSAKHTVIANNIFRQTETATAADGAITSGTPNFTSATASFVAGDVGKTITVEGAGAASADLVTTISAFVSGTAVTLTDNASTTVSGATYDYGLPKIDALDIGSGSYTHDLIFTGNRVIGTLQKANNYTLGGCRISSNSGNLLIDGNYFDSVNYAVIHNVTNNVSFINNFIDTAEHGIRHDRTASSGGGNDWLVANNQFKNIANDDLRTEENTSGTNPPKRWLVSGNKFDNNVAIAGGASNKSEDITLVGNVYASGATVDFSNATAMSRFGNVFKDDGFVRIEGLISAANDTAASAAGVPIGGLYRIASAIQVRIA